MGTPRRLTFAALVPGLMVVAVASGAQRSDPSRAVPQGAFVGVIKNANDSSPVRSADIRLYFMDSLGVSVDSAGNRSIETFIDTLRSRLSVSDSTGYFAVWRLAGGRYLMNVRRIGFAPVEAIVTVDTSTVLFDFTMTPVLPMLAKVEITATPSNSRANRRLDRAGFTNRTHFESGTFVKPDEILKRRAQTLRDILDVYGLRESAEYVLDKIPLDYSDIQDYPAEMIAGIEIYRHNRPIQFNMTRRGASIMGRGGQSNMMRPLVVIWTFIP